MVGWGGGRWKRRGDEGGAGTYTQQHKAQVIRGEQKSANFDTVTGAYDLYDSRG